MIKINLQLFAHKKESAVRETAVTVRLRDLESKGATDSMCWPAIS